MVDFVGESGLLETWKDQRVMCGILIQTWMLLVDPFYVETKNVIELADEYTQQDSLLPPLSLLFLHEKSMVVDTFFNTPPHLSRKINLCMSLSSSLMHSLSFHTISRLTSLTCWHFMIKLI